MSTPAGSDVGRYFADVPNRLVAFLIDLVFITILCFVGAIIISVLFGPVVTIDLSSDPRVSLDQGLALLNGGLSILISAAYFAITWHKRRGSPGQRLLRMDIGTEADGAMSYRQCLVRWLLIGLPISLQASLAPFVSGTVDAAVFLAVGVWYLVLLVGTARNPRKQGIHDRVAHTLVTKAGTVASWPEGSAQEQTAVVG